MNASYTHEHGTSVLVDFSANHGGASVWLDSESMVFDFVYSFDFASRTARIATTVTMFDAFTGIYFTADYVADFDGEHEMFLVFVDSFAQSLADADDLDYIASGIGKRLANGMRGVPAYEFASMLSTGQVDFGICSHEVLLA